jgi:DNA-binding CsgD family transcriptional regulator
MTTQNSSLDILERDRLTGQRDRAEQMWALAHLLTADDRALLRLHLDAGNSFRQIARMLGVRPSTVARRLRRIAKRLSDPTYPLCVRNRQRFSKDELAVIRDFFVKGLPLRQISRARNVSYYRARAAVEKAQGFATARTARTTEDAE